MGDEDSTKKNRFEPPPWEREAFDALAARRAEEQAAHEALKTAEPPAASASAQEPVVDWSAEVSKVAPAAPDAGAAMVTAGPADAGRPAAPASPVDEKAVAAMLLQLQNEERSDGQATKRVGKIAAALTIVLGLGMLIAGVVMMQGGGGKQVAVIGSLVLSIFGLAFMGMAAWVWIATTRSKGRR